MMIIGCRVSQVSRVFETWDSTTVCRGTLAMHSAVAEEIHQSGEYQCSQKEADDGPDIARLRSDRRVGGVQRV